MWVLFIPLQWGELGWVLCFLTWELIKHANALGSTKQASTVEIWGRAWESDRDPGGS